MVKSLKQLFIFGSDEKYPLLLLKQLLPLGCHPVSLCVPKRRNSGWGSIYGLASLVQLLFLMTSVDFFNVCCLFLRLLFRTLHLLLPSALRLIGIYYFFFNDRLFLQNSSHPFFSMSVIRALLQCRCMLLCPAMHICAILHTIVLVADFIL